MPTEISVQVTGTSLTGRTPAAKSFRVDAPVEVTVRWNLQGRKQLFVTFASSAMLRGPDTDAAFWSAGSGASGSSGEKKLRLAPGGYTAFVSADKGVTARLTVIVPDPPPAPPPVAPSPPPAAPAPPPVTSSPAPPASTPAPAGPAPAVPTAAGPGPGLAAWWPAFVGVGLAVTVAVVMAVVRRR